MTQQELEKAVGEVSTGEAILLDVRRVDEWNDGHAEQAINFDSQKILQQGELPNIEKDKKIYVHCVSGGRAGRVKMALLNHGFTNVENLGGLNDWYRAGGK